MASAILPHALTETWRPPTEPHTSAEASVDSGSVESPMVTKLSAIGPTTRIILTPGIVPRDALQIRRIGADDDPVATGWAESV